MKIVVITSCTGEKSVEHPDQLTLEDFKGGPEQLAARERDLRDVMVSAEDLYTGQQHKRLMRGVNEFRREQSTEEAKTSLELYVLSAGYGLVPGSQDLAPYETTFAGMKAGELRDWADTLGVPTRIREILAQSYDLALILLGDSYLKACSIKETIPLGGPALAFCGSRMAARLSFVEGLTTVPLTNSEAKRFSCGLVGLKGELAGRLLTTLAANPEMLSQLNTGDGDVLSLLEHDPPKKIKPGPQPNPRVDSVIQIPKTWNEQPHRSKIRYFIPEWDDQVDPDYDFVADRHSGGTGDWSNQVYAHQLYPEPNYDGILVSRIVAEKGNRKKERVNQMGIHRFLRVPRSFPVMGDCGAFGYIKEDEPPFHTSEILDYYTRLDFDYGVSIDHLIVSATEEDARFRYDLTINNARAFIEEHRSRGLDWTPIGAVQGWDARSYADAAHQYVEMGYRYIALGGLVRTSTDHLLPILQAVREVVPDDVNIHLFGIARENAIADLRRFGINSVDSASVLRKAWLGSDQNYLTDNGWLPAIRIPQVDRSFRAKRLVTSGAISEGDLQALESRCLTLIRQYASSGAASVPAELIAVLTEYDALIAGHRKSAEERIRRTLEERPWDQCPCSICRDVGVEVIIFRGNNRNRRRGFHNTCTFYRHFRDLVMTTETAPNRPIQKELFSIAEAG